MCGGCEIAAWARAASAAATSCDNDLEVPAGFRPACANMRGIDAHDEFAFWVIRQVQLHLAPFSRRRRLEPGAFTNPLVEALSQFHRAVSQGQRTRLIGSAGTRLSPPPFCDCRGAPNALSIPASPDPGRYRTGLSGHHKNEADSALAVHDLRVSNFDAAEHRPDLALA